GARSLGLEGDNAWLHSCEEIQRGYRGRSYHARSACRLLCADRRCPPFGPQGRVHCRHRQWHRYLGRTYQLSVSSFGSGTIGVSGGELVGTAHNFRTAADIAGTYKAAAAGLTVGAGGQVARFQNENGVILELVGAQLGLAVSLGSTGMTIALQAQ